MRFDTKQDWDWANNYLPAAFNVLRANAGYLVSFEIAAPHIDLKEMGDIVLSSNMGHVAFRVRRPVYTYRDLTIRSRRANGVETEIDKIRKGLGRWYLYAWGNDNFTFQDWILVDLDEFRRCGLAFEARREFSNKDRRTFFYTYSDVELNLNNCLVARHNQRIERLAAPESKQIPRPIRRPTPAAEYGQQALFEAYAYDEFHRNYYDD